MTSISSNSIANPQLLHDYTKNIILLLTILILTIGQFTTDIYLPSVPSIIDFFNSTTTQVQLSITLYYIGYGFSQFFYGPLSDYYGRRPIILIGISIYLAGTLLCLSAASITMLWLGRCVQGLGIGAAATLAGSVPQDLFTGAKITKAYSYIGIAIAITPLLAPILGGYLQSFIGWQANFWFLLTYAIFFAGVILFYFPETNAKALATHKIRFINLGGLLKQYIKMLSNQVYVFSILALVFTLLGEILFIVWMPIILQNHFKMTPMQNGWLMIFPALGLALGSYLTNQLTALQNKNIIIVTSLLVILFATFGFFLLHAWFGLSPPLLIAAMSIYMIGSGMSFPLYINLCISCYPQQSGAASALMSGLLSTIAGLWAGFLLKTRLVNLDLLTNVEIFIGGLLVGVAITLMLKSSTASDDKCV